MVKTQETELLFVGLVLQLLKPGGRQRVNRAPLGCCSLQQGTRRSRTLVDDHFLERRGVLPSGVFRPYAEREHATQRSCCPPNRVAVRFGVVFTHERR